MYTKSLIQMNLELFNIKENFYDSLTNIMEKYNIEDSVFVTINKETKELTKGYFVIENEYNNINDAIKNMDISSMGLRIIENKKFQTGNIYNNLSQCPKDKNKLDIDRLIEVE